MTALLLRALAILIACLATIAVFVFVWPKWSPQLVIPAAAVTGTVLFWVTCFPPPPIDWGRKPPPQ